VAAGRASLAKEFSRRAGAIGAARASGGSGPGASKTASRGSCAKSRNKEPCWNCMEEPVVIVDRRGFITAMSRGARQLNRGFGRTAGRYPSGLAICGGLPATGVGEVHGWVESAFRRGNPRDRRIACGVLEKRTELRFRDARRFPMGSIAPYSWRGWPDWGARGRVHEGRRNSTRYWTGWMKGLLSSTKTIAFVRRMPISSDPGSQRGRRRFLAESRGPDTPHAKSAREPEKFAARGKPLRKAPRRGCARNWPWKRLFPAG